MNGIFIKRCFVPSCNTNTKDNPEKLLFRLPHSEERRKKWCEAVTHYENRSRLVVIKFGYCCEDHFDLQEDIENWLEYKLTGRRIIWKKNVIPHKNLNLSQLRMEPFDEKRIKLDPTIINEETNDEDEEDMCKLNLKVRLYNIQTHPGLYLGFPEEQLYILKKFNDLPYLDILIILVKIRLNDSFERLAIEFGSNISTIENIINNGLPKMAKHFQHMIFWPEEDLIKQSLPIAFRLRYTDVQSIIFCLTINHEDDTFCKTLKYLISSTPNGMISFVSNGFDGRVTNEELVKNCGYLDLLPDNCAVVADREFENISWILKTKNCKLIVPRPDNETMEQMIECKRIAALKIQSEQVKTRLLEFEMLTSNFSLNSVQLLDHIIVIACGITNIQGAILK